MNDEICSGVAISVDYNSCSLVARNSRSRIFVTAGNSWPLVDGGG